MLRRELAAVARALSLVEDTRAPVEAEARALLAELHAVARSKGHRVGVTGPPGAGKSSLLSRMVSGYRRRGRSVGVLAIDPSSPRSGGALLGDRARMVLDVDDPDVFVRSMASGGSLGGLSRAAGAAVDVLGAAYDVVIVETTGVGQSETDIEHVTDTVLLVIQPASGDILQFIKSGIVEIPDRFVVNKSDLGAVATRAASELKSALRVADKGHDPDGVLLASATEDTGIDALLDSLDAHRRMLEQDGKLLPRRDAKAAQWGLRLLEYRSWQAELARLGGRAEVVASLEQATSAGQDALSAVHALAHDSRKEEGTGR
ncbi:MAG: methylmalonyl Co-A mutase-associated GTPase MeaB [Polyangiaceae bacterium]